MADRALREKYGWQYRLAQAVIRLLGLSARQAFLDAARRERETAPDRPSRYSGITVHDRNPVKSYLQRRRLRDALSVLDDLGEDFAGRILDFGGGVAS